MEQLNKEADNLHKAYYTGYGLALRGLVHNNHGVGKPIPYSRWDVRILHFPQTP
jgi:hypothetical protein